jgi:Rrf2 family iron-sulfur cluster assembly transcriptional regulator
MRLTTKGRYAVTAMLDLALNQGKGAVTLQDIALKQDISLSYLEQLFAKLRGDGMVRGTRGPGGGYRLARSAEAISVAAIISAVDEKADMTRCGGEANCQDGEKCLTHELWTELSLEIYQFLDGISLANLVSRPEVQEVAERQVITQQSHPSGMQSIVVDSDQLTGTTERH